METGKRRDVPTFVIVLFCIGAVVYLVLFWKFLVLLSFFVFCFYFVFRGTYITWKEGLTVLGLIVYVALMVTPLAKVWQLHESKNPREIVLQPPYRNLDRELRLFAASSATNFWMLTKPARPSESLGMKHSAALGLRGRVYEGKYPTQMEAVKLIKAGKFALADDLVSLSDQVDIHPNTLFQFLYGHELEIVPWVDWRRYVIVGHQPQAFTKQTLNFIDPKLKRAVKWARCGELCRVVAPMVQDNGVWRNNGGHIFLVEIWHGIVFARYDTTEDHPVFVYTK